jgi:hypothetical protein
MQKYLGSDIFHYSLKTLVVAKMVMTFKNITENHSIHNDYVPTNEKLIKIK